MNLAICTIQRDRGRWLREWIAFHYAVGFRKFYIYLHRCTDHSEAELTRLSKYFDITAFILTDDIDRPQLAAYQHCYNKFNNKHDWIAFIDGDEFLFSPCSIDISLQLEKFQDKSLSAIGVYWACFGSSGHVTEPEGLITENYRKRAPLCSKINKHFKSIVKGNQTQGFSVLQNSHYFKTTNGTFDSVMRPLAFGLTESEPNHEIFRINHYATQSREYFLNFKQKSGAADAGAQMIRSEKWWQEYDVNNDFDDSISHLHMKLSEILHGI